jgi:hypothetical protein
MQQFRSLRFPWVNALTVSRQYPGYFECTYRDILSLLYASDLDHHDPPPADLSHERPRLDISLLIQRESAAIHWYNCETARFETGGTIPDHPGSIAIDILQRTSSVALKSGVAIGIHQNSRPGCRRTKRCERRKHTEQPGNSNERLHSKPPAQLDAKASKPPRRDVSPNTRYIAK